MLQYTFLFLVMALISAVFGFGGETSAATGVAQISFVCFATIFVSTLIVGAVRS